MDSERIHECDWTRIEYTNVIGRRRPWRAAGRGDQHRGRIRTEIAQRVAQLKRLDALITERDYDLLHGEGDGGSGSGSGAGGKAPRGGLPVGVGGMMQKARAKMGAAKIGS